MAKVTITIEDMDTGVDVQLRFENPNRITQMPSAENTLAQNLAVVAMMTIEANARLNGSKTEDITAPATMQPAL